MARHTELSKGTRPQSTGIPINQNYIQPLEDIAGSYTTTDTEKRFRGDVKALFIGQDYTHILLLVKDHSDKTKQSYPDYVSTRAGWALEVIEEEIFKMNGKLKGYQTKNIGYVQEKLSDMVSGSCKIPGNGHGHILPQDRYKNPGYKAH